MRFTLLIPGLVLFIAAYSQTTSDITLANQYYNKGDSLHREGQFDLSIKAIAKAAPIYQKSNDALSLARVYHLTALNYLRLFENKKAIELAHGVQQILHDKIHDPILRAQSEQILAKAFLAMDQYDSAEYYQEKALEMLLEKVGENHVETANCYELKGDRILKKEGISRALEYYMKSLRIRKGVKEKDEQFLATTYRKIGQALTILPDYPKALLYLDSALSIQQNFFAANHPDMGETYHDLGVVHMHLNNFNKGLIYHKKAHEIFEAYYPDHHPLIINSYKGIGNLHYYQGDFLLSLEFYNQAIVLARKKYGENSTHVGAIYNNIGNVYFEVHQHEKGMEYRLKGLSVIVNILGENHPETALMYFSTGLNYIDLGQDSLALYYLNKSLNARLKIYGRDHYYVADCYGVIAGIYRFRGEMSKALDYYKQALEICQKIYWKDRRLVFCYYHTGIVHMYMNNLDSAILYMHKSIVYNSISFNDFDPTSQPPLDGYVSKNMLPWSMMLKAELFKMRYDRDHDISDLQNSLITYQVYDSLIEKIRRSYLRDKDKLFLGKRHVQAYEGAIAVCVELFDQTQNPLYKELAFYFSERNKAGILIESMTRKLLISDDKIPDHVLTLEKSIESELADRRTQLINMRNNKNEDGPLVVQMEKEIFTCQRKLDSIESEIEAMHPDFYQPKQLTIKGIKEIQESLPKNTLFIEFFEGEKDVYVFGLNKNEVKITKILNDSSYRQTLDVLGRLFSSDSTTNTLNSKEYANISYVLYDKLLKETIDHFTEDQEVHHLIIIPDGQLSYVPFDGLVQDLNETVSYRELDYLVRNFTISYGYTSMLTFAEKIKKPINYNYLAFAPTYSNQTEDSAQLLALGKFRNAVIPLKWTAHEVKTISKKANGSYYLGQEATESYFKEKAPDYGILHLAMHALIDDEEPMDSKFVFTQTGDSTDDGLLHAFELYNMELNADLAVLSACHTGYGTLARGEGIMSLARGFSYAGVPNLITSLWQVADQPSSDLMIFFYEEIEKGHSYAYALQQAKLRYLAQADDITSNPFYWSPFIYVGNPEARIIPSERRIWLVVAGVLILSLGFILRKKYLKVKKT